jgi:putative SOS response-associated peptidase YedK
MCGRIVRKTGSSEIAHSFAAKSSGIELPLNFNISPTSDVYVIRSIGDSRTLDVMSWGLVPSWAKDTSRAASLINARSESVHERPSFRNLITRNRCVMPVDAYYEWKPMKIRGKQVKQPFIFMPVSESPFNHSGQFAIAGLWSSWIDKRGEILLTCTALTTEANITISEVHHRMPVLLTRDGVEGWLSNSTSPDFSMTQNIDNSATRHYAVSTEVNNARNHGEHLLDPVPLGESDDATLF